MCAIWMRYSDCERSFVTVLVHRLRQRRDSSRLRNYNSQHSRGKSMKFVVKAGSQSSDTGIQRRYEVWLNTAGPICVSSMIVMPTYRSLRKILGRTNCSIISNRCCGHLSRPRIIRRSLVPSCRDFLSNLPILITWRSLRPNRRAIFRPLNPQHTLGITSCGIQPSCCLLPCRWLVATN